MTKRILFFDFDGTLAPIVRNPADARLPIKIKGWLSRIARKRGVKVAIVTGRSLEDIRKRVGLRNIIYAANHGAEISLRGRMLLAKGKRLRAPLRKIADELNAALGKIPNVLVENKGLSVSVHLRRVPKAVRRSANRKFSAVLKPWLLRYPLRASAGKMVLELRSARWDKGSAVMWIWNKTAPDHYPYYVGDDQTDEDAFKALRPYGTTICVGKKSKTNAKRRSGSFLKLLGSGALERE